MEIKSIQPLFTHIVGGFSWCIITAVALHKNKGIGCVVDVLHEMVL